MHFPVVLHSDIKILTVLILGGQTLNILDANNFPLHYWQAKITKNTFDKT